MFPALPGHFLVVSCHTDAPHSRALLVECFDLYISYSWMFWVVFVVDPLGTQLIVTRETWHCLSCIELYGLWLLSTWLVHNLSMDILEDSIFILLSAPTIEKDEGVLNSDCLWVTDFRKRASRVGTPSMLQVPLMSARPRYSNRRHLTHVFLLSSDHGNLCVLSALCVQWAECLLEMLRQREPLNILKPKFWKKAWQLDLMELETFP